MLKDFFQFLVSLIPSKKFLCFFFFVFFNIVSILLIINAIISQVNSEFIVTILPHSKDFSLNLGYFHIIFLYFSIYMFFNILLILVYFLDSWVFLIAWYATIQNVYMKIIQGLLLKDIKIINNFFIKIQKRLTEEDCLQLFQDILKEKFWNKKFDSEMSFESFYLYLKQHNIEDYDHICRCLKNYLMSHLHIDQPLNIFLNLYSSVPNLFDDYSSIFPVPLAFALFSIIITYGYKRWLFREIQWVPDIVEFDEMQLVADIIKLLEVGDLTVPQMLKIFIKVVRLIRSIFF